MRMLESLPAGADKDSLAHERGNRTGIAIFKNRRYLRKKSFFERFFAHKTGRDTKKKNMSVSVQLADINVQLQRKQSKQQLKKQNKGCSFMGNSTYYLEGTTRPIQRHLANV